MASAPLWRHAGRLGKAWRLAPPSLPPKLAGLHAELLQGVRELLASQEDWKKGNRNGTTSTPTPCLLPPPPKNTSAEKKNTEKKNPADKEESTKKAEKKKEKTDEENKTQPWHHL